MFTLSHRDGYARRGRLVLPHGPVETPVFMPVATAATIKSIDTADIQAMGYRILLANTYHLALRPGVEIVEALGGIRGMMTYDGNILTDSGGYQVFSLSDRRKILENGVQFQSHLDGSTHMFTPESVQELQRRFGSTIVMPLDICPPGDGDRVTMAEACRTTRRWYLQAVAAKPTGLLYGIAQGGTFPDMRREEILWMVEQNPPGMALGGFSVGEERSKFWDTLAAVADVLPSHIPVYVMGVGDPRDLVYCVSQGVDMFDCVLPTRNARNGRLYVRNGYYNVHRKELASLDRPPDPDCNCPTCSRYSIGYLRHLCTASELSFYRYATLHNLHWFARLMQTMREQLEAGTYQSWARAYLSNWVGNYSDPVALLR